MNAKTTMGLRLVTSSPTGLVFVIGVLAGIWGGSVSGRDIRVVSPDGAVRFVLGTDQGQLTYAVAFKKTAVIEKSELRFTVDGDEFTAGSHVTGAKEYRVNETYPWHGVHSTATNRCNGTQVGLHSDQAGLD